jgi:hypothetical protein
MTLTQHELTHLITLTGGRLPGKRSLGVGLTGQGVIALRGKLESLLRNEQLRDCYLSGQMSEAEYISQTQGTSV